MKQQTVMEYFVYSTWIVWILVALLLTGCANKGFNPPEFNNVVIVEVEINDNIGFDEYDRSVAGQAVRINGICYIQVPTITWLYDSYNMCIWGHEFMHCVFGVYHTKDDMGTC